MATNSSLNAALKQQPAKVNPNTLTMTSLLKSDMIAKKFNSVLQDKAPSFISSLVSLVNEDDYLSKSKPMSVVASAMVAATLDLPINRSLGYAYIVPFSGVAQFIMGYKGYIQLAQRSGQYHKLNVATIPEGVFISWDPLSEELKYDFEKKTSDKAVGYAGTFELLNGFTKTVYWTKDQIEAHRIANNKSRNKKALSGAWVDNYDAMAEKTVLRSMLGRWGILSIEMQNAMKYDETTHSLNDDGDLVDDPIDITDSASSDSQDDQTIQLEDGQTVVLQKDVDKKPAKKASKKTPAGATTQAVLDGFNATENANK